MHPAQIEGSVPTMRTRADEMPAGVPMPQAPPLPPILDQPGEPARAGRHDPRQRPEPPRDPGHRTPALAQTVLAEHQRQLAASHQDYLVSMTQAQRSFLRIQQVVLTALAGPRVRE